MIPVLFHLGPLTIYSFGVMAALALISACYVAYRLLRTRGVPFEFAYELLFVAGLGGFAGARLYYIVQHWSGVKGDLWGSLFSGSGFTWYGGLIGGFVCVALWSRFRHVPVGLMANAAGPGVAIGYAVGRIGCQLSGDGDYGRPTTSFLGMGYPHGTVPTPPGVEVWPTPIFETLAMVLVCWYLYRMARKPQPGWYVWGWFMVLAGIERFLIEFIRRNPVVLLGLRTPQWESVISIAIGVWLILYTRNRPTVEMELAAAAKAKSVKTRAGAGSGRSPRHKPAKAGRTGA
jgi:phosphatidylglycerol:prolipoprotein diacylglycerol transferase